MSLVTLPLFKRAGTLEQFPKSEKPEVSAKELLDRIKGVQNPISKKKIDEEDPTEGAEKKAGYLDEAIAQIEKTLQGRKMMDELQQNANRAPAALDVLKGNSMALPDWALKAGAGGLAGYAGGAAAGAMATPSIDPDMREGDAAEIRRKRKTIQRVGALLGMVGGAATDPKAQGAFQDLRNQFAV